VTWLLIERTKKRVPRRARAGIYFVMWPQGRTGGLLALMVTGYTLLDPQYAHLSRGSAGLYLVVS
jgi:hypothetical protein